jgi:hypothetical protein
VWQYSSVIPALKKLRQEDQEFEVSLDSKRDPISKKKKIKGEITVDQKLQCILG